MESSTNNAPLIVVVGPTASGKSRLAMALAAKFDGEIIAADSRTIYKGMDIGTAKPTRAERERVPYHLIDIVNPDESFTVADFKVHANQYIDEITSRKKLPIMTGGTGLYIDSVLFDFSFQNLGDPERRLKLRKLSVEELQEILTSRCIALPENSQNPRHLIRRIETGTAMAEMHGLRPNTVIVGLDIDREVLKHRIEQRAKKMLASGLGREVRTLSDLYGWNQALQTIGYREFEPYFAGAQTIDEVRTKIVQHTNGYAKRQRTWFARNKSIHWFNEQVKAEDFITTFLSK